MRKTISTAFVAGVLVTPAEPAQASSSLLTLAENIDKASGRERFASMQVDISRHTESTLYPYGGGEADTSRGMQPEVLVQGTRDVTPASQAGFGSRTAMVWGVGGALLIAISAMGRARRRSER